MIDIIHGDCLEVLRGLDDASHDSLVTDPPAGISFMNREWDSAESKWAWIDRMQRIFRECFRVLKPGAHGLVWALPRTSHWTANGLDEAGFEIRDSVHHIFGSGFPKSLDISKALDRAAGAVREVIGTQRLAGNAALSTAEKRGTYGVDVGTAEAKEIDVTAPATDLAKLWNGWGTALKPAHEVWWLVRKPLDGSVAENIRAHGVGGINVDACRVGDSKRTPSSISRHQGYGFDCDYSSQATQAFSAGAMSGANPDAGRWPANLVFSHSIDCANHMCADDCPVRELDRQSGPVGGAAPASGPTHSGPRESNSIHRFNGQSGPPVFHGKTSGASSFFNVFRPDCEDITWFLYASKAAMSEKNDGLDSRKAKKFSDGRKTPVDHPRLRGETLRRNTHPTVKSLELMRWGARLVTPPRGRILDPFAGSGSTPCAAHEEGFSCTAIEREAEYVEIIRARVAFATRQQRLFG